MSSSACSSPGSMGGDGLTAALAPPKTGDAPAPAASTLAHHYLEHALSAAFFATLDLGAEATPLSADALAPGLRDHLLTAAAGPELAAAAAALLEATLPALSAIVAEGHRGCLQNLASLSRARASVMAVLPLHLRGVAGRHVRALSRHIAAAQAAAGAA